MSNTYEKIKELITSGEVRISEHGYDELVNDNLTAREAVESVATAIIVEDYPNYPKDLLFCCYNRTRMSSQFMWSGEYRKDIKVPLFW